MGEREPLNKLVPSAETLELQQSIQAWQKRFDYVPAKQDTEASDRLRHQAVAELIELFPLEGNLVVYGGGYGTRIVSDEDGPHCEETHFPGGLAYWQGFEVIKRGPRQSPTWRLAHVLYQEDEGAEDYGDQTEGTEARTVYLYAPGNIVSGLLEVETAFHNIIRLSENPLLAAMSQVAEDAAETLLNPDFLRYDLTMQRRIVDSFIEHAEAQADVLGPIKDQPVICGTDRVYVLRVQDGHCQYEELPVDDEVPVEGECLGLTVLAKRQLDAGIPISTQRELCDDDGLCLVIRPNATTVEDLDIPANLLFYVPISNELALSFDPELTDYDSE